MLVFHYPCYPDQMLGIAPIPPWSWLAVLVVQPWLTVLVKLLSRGCWDLSYRLPRNPELLGDDVTQVLEILQSFLKSVNSSSSLFNRMLVPTLVRRGWAGPSPA